MSLPTIWNYGPGSPKSNCMGVSVGGIDIYFSYTTPVAIRRGSELVVRQNNWGPTTGKHLNSIDDGARGDRVGVDEFQKTCREWLSDPNPTDQETSQG